MAPAPTTAILMRAILLSGCWSSPDRLLHREREIKRPGAVQADTAADASNALFRGAVAQTGEALALAVGTGADTLFGRAARVEAPR